MFLEALLALTYPTQPEHPRYDPVHLEYAIAPASGFDGVVLIEVNPTEQGAEKYCTGSLLRSGRHILTAAQCLRGNGETLPNIRVAFDVPAQAQTNTTQVTSISTHQRRKIQAACFPNPNPVDLNLTGYCVNAQTPDFVTFLYRSPDELGSLEEFPEPPSLRQLLNGQDLAVLELTEAAPATADRYAIYRRSGERGQRFLRVGYGLTGSGLTGEQPHDPNIPILKRLGANRYDAHEEELLQAIVPPTPESVTSRNQLSPLEPVDAAAQTATPAPCLPTVPLPAYRHIPPRFGREDNFKTLVYDFDSGTCTHDVLGREFGLYDVGLLNYAPNNIRNWQQWYYNRNLTTGLALSPISSLELFNTYRADPTAFADSPILDEELFPESPKIEGVLDPLDPVLARLLSPRPGAARLTITPFLESGWGKGDEGSPAFIDGQIAGIASRRVAPAAIDITEGDQDGSFGEYFVDVRVSAYAEFIDAVLVPRPPVPLPDQR